MCSGQTQQTICSYILVTISGKMKNEDVAAAKIWN